VVNLPPFLRQQNDGTIILSVKVQPRSSRNEICDVMGAELKVKIAAPPVDAAANEELIRFLASVLDCPRNAVRIIRGGTSKHKSIAIDGVSTQQIEQRLRPAA
jgi:uncharacterized protein